VGVQHHVVVLGCLSEGNTGDPLHRTDKKSNQTKSKRRLKDWRHLMYKLKTLSKEAIPAALKMAERYRLLGEALEAESICRDVLKADPDNQDALIMLFLSLTDAFKRQLNPNFSRAQDVLEQLNDRYCSAYYNGILCERRAKVHLERGEPGSGRLAYEWFHKAMDYYENALVFCSPGNQDALLRWNTCARVLMRQPGLLTPPMEDTGEQMLE
jgi:hypothetical protein